MIYSNITGIGHYVPENKVTNFDLEKMMDTSDEWIRERTGIEERRYFDPEKDTVANMAAKASATLAQVSFMHFPWQTSSSKAGCIKIFWLLVPKYNHQQWT